MSNQERFSTRIGPFVRRAQHSVPKNERAANLRSLLLACTLPRRYIANVQAHLLVEWQECLTVATDVAPTPAGSTRTTASANEQNARIPVWFRVTGLAFA